MRKILLSIITVTFFSAVSAGPKPGAQAPDFGCGSDTVSVFFIGDVMMHRRQLDYDFHPFLEKISHRMREADICVANMEFTLAGEPYTGYPSFSAPDAYAAYLASDCGTDVFLMANNHILDKGRAGLSRTLDKYSGLRDSLGVLFTGAAADSASKADSHPLIIDCKGIRIAIINFTYGTNVPASSAPWPAAWTMGKAGIGEAFEAARHKKADFILALPHWGEEYNLIHSPQQEEWAEWLVGQGADLIVGTHPHVVQDSTHINGVPVFYSIGNAVSNMSAENTRLELAVTARFAVDRLTHEKKMLEPSIDFMWCTLPGCLGDNYSTIFVKEWAARRSAWLTLSDYENMLDTWQRVRDCTGIED